MKDNKISISAQPRIFTLLTYELLSLTDKGVELPVMQFLRMCEDYSIMSWLNEKTRIFDSLDDEVKIILAEEFASLANVVSPEDDYGISNNGILVLIAFCQELINSKPTRDIKDCETAEQALNQLNLL